MKELTASSPAVTVGVDIGDRTSHVAVIDAAGRWIESSQVPTTARGFSRAFLHYEGARIVLEVGSTHSPWISRILAERGFDVVVANPRRVRLIAAAGRKNDDIDAEVLARLARVDPELLVPIQHREHQAQNDLVLRGTRGGFVQSRTKLINVARGHAKALGFRLPSWSAEAFHRRAADVLSEEDVPGIALVLQTIGHLTATIRELDRRIEALAADRYPETKVLRQIPGVGPLTALCFVLTIEDPMRFASSRQVGAYLGLVPKQRDSGDRQPQLGISKRGDVMLRRLLVGSARYINGPFGPDTDLRAFGLRLSASGGRAARNRAAIAVARKLAVLLHRLWLTGEVYQTTRIRSVDRAFGCDQAHRDACLVGADNRGHRCRADHRLTGRRRRYRLHVHKASHEATERQGNAVSGRLRGTVRDSEPESKIAAPDVHGHHPAPARRRAARSANGSAVDGLPDSASLVRRKGAYIPLQTPQRDKPPRRLDEARTRR